MEIAYEALIQGLLEEGFATVENWFNPEDVHSFRQELERRYEQEEFRLAGIGQQSDYQHLEAVRNDQILWLSRPSSHLQEQFFFSRLDGFVDYLNRTCFAGIVEYEFHYAFYNQGAFYKRHKDRFHTDDRRRFSMVIYLNPDWQQGDGGELNIYPENGATYTVTPTAGKVVFFDSGLDHEVLVSQKPRYSLTGWLKTR